MKNDKNCINCKQKKSCERIEKKISYCDFWTKKDKSLKLESKKGLNFNFKEV